MAVMYAWAIIFQSYLNVPHNAGWMGSYESIQKCENDRFFFQNTLITINPQYKFQKIEAFCLNLGVN